MPPLGGLKDTLPPLPVRAIPGDSAKNTKPERILLEFNEYIQLQNVQQQLVVSPVPKIQPIIEAKLKTLTIKIKDTLQDNTTYSYHFGSAIQDINESNPLKGFSYAFSTGPNLDTASLSGMILMAENGKPDSTIVAILQPDLSDTAVLTRKARYFTRLNGKGYFRFQFIAPGTYNVFALKDADGSLSYNQDNELFGFLSQPITLGQKTEPVLLYAFLAAEQPKRTFTSTPAKTKNDDKRLRYAVTDAGNLDIDNDLEMKFDRKPTRFDTSKIYLAPDSGQRIPARISLDSNTVRISHTWEPGKKYKLFIEKGLAQDTLGNSVLRNDTIKISTRKLEDYGSLTLRIMDLDTAQHPVLLFYSGETLKRTAPLTANRMTFKRIIPGEYQLKILFDRNNNGKWDTGDYSKKLQPEIVKPREQSLNIRANWDNEVDINIKALQNQQ